MGVVDRWLRRGRHVSDHTGGLDLLRYVGPGLLVTVGFVDPGNWASNMAAGSAYGYGLLWMVTLSTIMLVVLQHNAAHLGIVTGTCLAEAATANLPHWLSRVVLGSALLATVATIMAEILGGAIALQMLVGLPVRVGSVAVAAVSALLLLTNSYRKVERIIIGFVSLIGVSFLAELALVQVDWPQALACSVAPQLPEGSLPVVMSVLGAVVMPHNLFLHSEVIQSRKVNLKGTVSIERTLKFEFIDTLLSMGIGWAINSAMIVLAAATFFSQGVEVADLAQAAVTLAPMAGPAASAVFALALLLAGVASSVTAGMAAGTISAGAYGEPMDVRDRHTRVGVMGCFLAAIVCVFLVQDVFAGLVWSQALLSIQLPVTIAAQVYLTSSRRVMGRYANGRLTRAVLVLMAAAVSAMNVALVISEVCAA